MKNLFIVLSLFSFLNVCYAQNDPIDEEYKVYYITDLTSSSSAWHEMFFNIRNAYVVKKLYPYFKAYVNKIDLGELSPHQISKLYDYSLAYTEITWIKDPIPALIGAHELVVGIKEYTGRRYSDVSASTLSQYIDEIYRSLDIDILKRVRINNYPDRSIERLLFTRGFAKFCIERKFSSNWNNQTSPITRYRYARQAEDMLDLYKKHYGDDAIIEPSTWIKQAWKEQRYQDIKARKEKLPGLGLPWSLDDLDFDLDRIAKDPNQEDVRLYLGVFIRTGRNRGLARITTETQMLMSKTDESRLDLLNMSNNAANGLLKAVSKGQISITDEELKLINRYVLDNTKLINDITVEQEQILKSAYSIEKEYYDNGKLKYYGELRNGMPYHKKWFYDTGYKKKQENYNIITGVIESSIERSESGTIIRESVYDMDGKRVSSIEYYPDGKIKEKWSPSGLFVYDENGKLIQRICDEDHPLYDSKVENYDDNGKIASVSYYKGSQLVFPEFVMELEKGEEQQINVTDSKSEKIIQIINDLERSKIVPVDLAIIDKVDLFFKDMILKGLNLDSKDLRFLFGVQESDGINYTNGALDYLMAVLNDKGVSQTLRDQAYSYVLLLICLSCTDSNFNNLDPHEYSVIANIADDISLMNVAPSILLESSLKVKLSPEMTLSVMSGYSNILQKTYQRSIIKK